MDSLSVLLAHVTGTPNSRQAAQALFEKGHLFACHHSVAWNVRPVWWSAFPKSWLPFFNRRFFAEMEGIPFKNHPLAEIMRLGSRLAGKAFLGPRAARLFSIEAINQKFDEAVAASLPKTGEVAAVYGYMDTSERTFRKAKQTGLRTFYELPTPYWRFTRDIVVEEALLKRDWAATLPVIEEDSEVMKKRDRELQLADVVIVPSEFVRDSLRAAPSFQGEVHVVPYGCPETVQSQELQVESFTRPRLRVLYVGSLNQGKGLAYLAEAMEGLKGNAELTVVGSRTTREECPALDSFLAANRYLSRLSHTDVLAEMRRNDVLVLPSLYEGLALVLLEAMACGLTVVATGNSGIAGMITNGCEGFLVPPRDSSALRARLLQLDSDRPLLASMREAALNWSREHSWSRYREQLCAVVATFMEESAPQPSFSVNSLG